MLVNKPWLWQPIGAQDSPLVDPSKIWPSKYQNCTVSDLIFNWDRAEGVISKTTKKSHCIGNRRTELFSRNVTFLVSYSSDTRGDTIRPITHFSLVSRLRMRGSLTSLIPHALRCDVTAHWSLHFTLASKSFNCNSLIYPFSPFFKRNCTSIIYDVHYIRRFSKSFLIYQVHAGLYQNMGKFFSL